MSKYIIVLRPNPALAVNDPRKNNIEVEAESYSFDPDDQAYDFYGEPVRDEIDTGDDAVYPVLTIPADNLLYIRRADQ